MAHRNGRDVQSVSLPGQCSVVAVVLAQQSGGELHNETDRLENPNAIKVMTPFKPMLGQRETSLKEIFKSFGTEPKFYIETKYDGDRVVLHKKGDKYFFHTRRGKDWTHSYGADANSGTFTKHVHKLFAPEVDEVILDGEMMVWETIEQRYIEMGEEGTKVRSLGSEQHVDKKTGELVKDEFGHKRQPCFVVFDVLNYKGELLVEQPLERRRQLMSSGTVFTQTKGRIVLSDMVTGTTLEDLEKSASASVDNQHEGIVIKDTRSQYAKKIDYSSTSVFVNSRSTDGGTLDTL